MTNHSTNLSAKVLLFMLTACSMGIYAGENNIVNEGTLTLDELMEIRKSVKKTSANFNEKKFMSAFNEPLVLKGKLLYQSPGNLIKHYISPDNIRYEATNDIIHIETTGGFDEEIEQQSIDLNKIPALHSYITALRGILGGDLNKVREHFKVKFSSKDRNWKIILSPINKLGNEIIREFNFEGLNEKVLTIEILENSGDSTVTMIQSNDTFKSPTQ